MNAPVAIVSPSVDDLICRAVEDHGVLINMAWTEHLTDAAALHICAQAVDAAIEDWAYDTQMPEASVLPAMRDVVLHRLLSAGWAAREAKDQGDLFESRAIWEGAAAHEARKELG